MNESMRIYDYEILHNPTPGDVNRLGAQGYRVHSMALDPRDGALAVIIMERGGEAVLIDGAILEVEPPAETMDDVRQRYNGTPKRGRK